VEVRWVASPTAAKKIAHDARDSRNAAISRPLWASRISSTSTRRFQVLPSSARNWRLARDPIHVYDLQATQLRQLGIDHTQRSDESRDRATTGAAAGRLASVGRPSLDRVLLGQHPRSNHHRPEDVMEYTRFSGLLELCSLLPAGAVQEQTGGARPDYKDPALPTARRVEDLLARMTLEEKVAQMLCLWSAKRQITDAQGRFDPARAPEWFRLGIGRIERPSDGHGARAQAEFTNAIQRWVKEHTRLGIPVIFHEEALHGLQGEEATSFPQAIALASTWNPDLVERLFATVAQEVRARGAQQVLAPVVDVARDLRWGRFEETYGEDPYLVARLGLAAVRGLQGGAQTIPAQRVIATLKHLAGHGQPESGTNTGPAPFGERTLREVFFYPFEVAVKDGHARSVMPSYNEIDGIPSHANRWMLRDVLRGEWGFDGTIVSDWQAISQLAGRHRVAADAADAARQALAATVDVELPDVESYPTLVGQVRQGTVPEAAINDAVRRLLRAKLELGLFEDPTVDLARAEHLSGSAASRPLALEAARQAIVLLQNRGGRLPLQAAQARRVAVIGPHAAEVLLGGYSGAPRHSVSILEGIRRRLGAGATVKHAEGVRITEDSVFTRGPQPLVGGTRSQARWSADRVVRPTRPPTGAASRRRWRWRTPATWPSWWWETTSRPRARHTPRITWATGRSCGWWDSRRSWCGRCSTRGRRRCWC
jgi:beta-glucosidase-like glycosyl hydrolase